MQAVGRLLAGIDDALSQFFQFFVDLFPVVLKFLQDFLQGLGKGGLQVGIVIQIHVKMVADGVLDLGGLGFGPFSFSDLTFKVLVQNRDGGDFEVDALGFQIGIGDSPELGRNPFHAQALVAEMLSRQYVDFRELLIIRHKVEGFLGRKDKIEALGEFLKCQHVLEAQVFIVKKIEKGVMVVEVGQAMFFKKRHNRPMGGPQIIQLFFRKTQGIENVLLLALVGDLDGLFQVMADADVIDHKPLVLALAADPVHPGDGLQQVVGNNHLVQIHHLLHRCIEPGEQHVPDDDDAHVAGDALILAAERKLEALDARFVL